MGGYLNKTINRLLILIILILQIAKSVLIKNFVKKGPEKLFSLIIERVAKPVDWPIGLVMLFDDRIQKRHVFHKVARASFLVDGLQQRLVQVYHEHAAELFSVWMCRARRQWSHYICRWSSSGRCLYYSWILAANLMNYMHLSLFFEKYLFILS